jgi:hypothetical protein
MTEWGEGRVAHWQCGASVGSAEPKYRWYKFGYWQKFSVVSVRVHRWLFLMRYERDVVNGEEGRGEEETEGRDVCAVPV